MNKKLIIGVSVVAAVFVVWFFAGRQSGGSSPGIAAPVAAPAPTSAVAAAPNSAEASSSPAPGSAASSSAAEQGQSAEVDYTDSGFSPAALTIKAGTTVNFVNKNSSPFWPASNPHPFHNGYPTTGGCVGSTFDACRAIAPGGSWSFKFDIVGSWGYHDHLNPGRQGTITVQ